MTVNRTTLLDLPLPVTGTESGTWGDTTNNGLTQYMDIAIAGMSNLTSANFTAGALTIETTEGDSSATNISATSAQYAGFRVSSLAVNSTITVGNTGTSPARSYRLINADATYSLTFKATGQTGVTFLPGQTGVVAFNGTDYVIVGVVGAGTATDNAVARFDGTTGEILQSSGVTIDDSNNVSGVAQLNITTLDATNIEVTNIKAKDGTAAASIADSTGIVTVTAAPVLSSLTASQAVFTTAGKALTSNAITGTGNVVMSASPTLTGTVSAAAATLSSDLTLNGGTANGVAYLNGSKVLTTGSALTFDTARLSFIKASNGRAWSADGDDLFAIENSTSANADFRTSTTGATYLMFSDTDARARGYVAYLHGSDSMPFAVAGSEQMRLTSTGLGIGTSSPSSKLEVAVSGQAQQLRLVSAGNVIFRTRWIDATTGFALESNNSAESAYYPFKITGSVIRFGTGDGADKATLDSSGNLGLGVTPSAWTTNISVRALQLGGGSVYSYDNNRIFVGQNVAITGSGSDTYVNTAEASAYRQFQGAHAWYTAPSGTAGNAISFTQAMTLDASGKLLVGTTTSPNQQAVFYRTSATTSNGALLLDGNGNYAGIQFAESGNLRASIAVDSSALYLTHESVLTFKTGSTGNVGGTERARITSGGEFLLSGLTSSVGSYWLQIKNTNSSANGAYMENASGNDRGILVMKHDQAAGATTGAMIVFQNSSGSTVGSITSSNTATAYNLSSDRRLKENIVSADDAGSLIDNIEVVKFDWKVGGHNRYGFIAQDLHAVAPEAVTAGDDGDEIEKVWGVDYSKLVPMLVKEIQSLRARVALLEGTQP